MTNRPLSSGLDLEALKSAAKSILKSVKGRDQEALERIKPYFGDSTSVKLTQMQLVLAREYGFDSWAKLRSYLKVREELKVAQSEVAKITRRLSGKQPTKDVLYCSFCAKTQHEVKKLIAGPGVYVCDECVVLCNEIMREELKPASA